MKGESPPPPFPKAGLKLALWLFWDRGRQIWCCKWNHGVGLEMPKWEVLLAILRGHIYLQKWVLLIKKILRGETDLMEKVSTLLIPKQRDRSSVWHFSDEEGNPEDIQRIFVFLNSAQTFAQNCLCFVRDLIKMAETTMHSLLSKTVARHVDLEPSQGLNRSEYPEITQSI